MRTLSEQSEALQESPLSSFFKRAKGMENIISLGVGEPYKQTPKFIKESGISAIQGGHTKYVPSNGLMELRQALGKKLGYDLNSIVVSSGAKPLIVAALWALTNKNRGVIIPTPYYPPFVEGVKLWGGCPILLDTSKFGFHLTPELLKKCLDQAIVNSFFGDHKMDILPLGFNGHPSVIVINSPNNPTGAIYSEDDLEFVADLVKEYDLCVISDECYCDYVYSGKFCSFASIKEMKERTVTIRSFSKSYAMTGWRVGYAAGPRKVMEKIALYVENFVGCACSISQYAALSALNDENDLKQEMLREFSENRQILMDWLKAKKIPFADPEGAFYIFADFSSLLLQNDSVALANLFLEKAGVALTPGISFGKDYGSYMRISYAIETSRLKEALSRLEFSSF